MAEFGRRRLVQPLAVAPAEPGQDQGIEEHDDGDDEEGQGDRPLDQWPQAAGRGHEAGAQFGIPLFIHHPDHAGRAGTRSSALTQTADLAATFLDLYGAAPPEECRAQSLLPLLDGAASAREAALFGYFGGAINVTDGRYTYHRYPPDLQAQVINQYTLMPTHIFSFFTPEELAAAELTGPMAFTKGAPLLKVPVTDRSPMYDVYGPGALLEDETRLFDLETDPGQERPLDDPELEAALARTMARLMQDLAAPDEAFARVALEPPFP